jgi:hypothetical protein
MQAVPKYRSTVVLMDGTTGTVGSATIEAVVVGSSVAVDLLSKNGSARQEVGVVQKLLAKFDLKTGACELVDALQYCPQCEQEHIPF